MDAGPLLCPFLACFYFISETGAGAEVLAPSPRNFPENLGRGRESALARADAASVPARGP